MVFNVLSAYSVELIALAAGVFLLVQVAKGQIAGKLLAKFVAWFIVVVSVLLMIFTTLYSFSYCQAGKFSPYKWGGRGEHWKGPGMMRGGFGEGPGMKGHPMTPKHEDKKPHRK